MTQSNQDFISIEGDAQPLLKDGEYTVKLVGWDVSTIFGGRLFLLFEIVDPGENFGVRIYGAYRIKLSGKKSKKWKVRRRSKLFRQLVPLLDGKHLRPDRISLRPLKGVLLRVKTRTVTRDEKQRPLAKMLHYSVVDSIQGIAVGQLQESGSLGKERAEPPQAITQAAARTGDAVSGPGSQAISRRTDSTFAAPGKCPTDQILALYNKLLPMCQSAEPLGLDSNGRIRQCWQEHPDINWWRTLFQRVAASPFLTGKVPPKDERRQFLASLPWIVDKAEKILSGKYDPRNDLRMSSAA